MVSKYKLNDNEIYKYVYEPLKSNMYINISGKEALVIDPWSSKEAFEFLKSRDVKRVTIILTHEHYDHISGVNDFRENFDCYVIGNEKATKLVINPKKNFAAFSELIFPQEIMVEGWKELYDINENYSCEIDWSFCDKTTINWMGTDLELISTPGHSPGSICIKSGNVIFTGDSLVDGNDIILRFPGGSKNEYNNKTRKFLMNLQKHTVVFPGHGAEGKIENFHIL